MAEAALGVLAKTQHGGAKHRAAATHVVVSAGTKFVIVFVDPLFLRHLALVRENGADIPILWLLRKVISSFEDHHGDSMLHQAMGERSFSDTTADDDDFRRRHGSPVESCSVSRPAYKPRMPCQ
jgi:hypothetical protein